MRRFAMAFAVGMAALPLLWAQAGATGAGTTPNPTPNSSQATAPNTTTPQSNNNKTDNGKPRTYGDNPPANPGVKTPIVDPAKGALGNHGNTPANPYEGTKR